MKAGRKEHCRSMRSGSGGPWPIRRVRKRLLQQIRQKTGNMIVRQGPDQLLFAGYSKIPDSRPRHESRGFLQIRIYIYRQDGGTEHVARGHFHPRIAFRQHVLDPVSYTHLRAHETKANLVCRLLLEKKKQKKKKKTLNKILIILNMKPEKNQ